ncbi:hypothetical protein [Streptomyces sp. SID3343]|uniref:hypothetical protein n=1 Tax=Streptomyces sp. SID3343 TaxID=2690260 RepID=UPI00136C215A|nr:hypothetical protein [Streptomyces sp. SID3343]MYV97143.1 hypothetical protein [Streptomyces sp. SID3343]
MTQPKPPRSLPALADVCDFWTDHPWPVVRDAARDAGPAMREAIVVAGHWDTLSPTHRAGVLWDMTTAHTIATTDERRLSAYETGARMARLAAAIRHADTLSTTDPFGARVDAVRLAEEVDARLLALPAGWRTEGLRRIAAGELDPLGAVSGAGMAINMARNVYGIAAE